MARWISLLGAFTVVMMATSQPQQLPLLAYVAQKDDAFSWQKVSSDRSPLGVTFHELRLTSQRWKGMVWRHTLLIAQPPKVATDLALLVIAGGETDSRGDPQSRLLFPPLPSNCKPSSPSFTPCPTNLFLMAWWKTT